MLCDDKKKKKRRSRKHEELDAQDVLKRILVYADDLAVQPRRASDDALWYESSDSFIRFSSRIVMRSQLFFEKKKKREGPERDWCGFYQMHHRSLKQEMKQKSLWHWDFFLSFADMPLRDFQAVCLRRSIAKNNLDMDGGCINMYDCDANSMEFFIRHNPIDVGGVSVASGFCRMCHDSCHLSDSLFLSLSLSLSLFSFLPSFFYSLC